MQMRSDKIFHIISNTHWDREWRFPFQRNRQMLVEMIDNVINILLNEPDYKAFHLDSQSVIIEDYLEVKPQNKEILRKLILDKRILIGPWYILPDEFQVGGENLIRNLLLGHKICNELGRVSKSGYSPFSWGQISQLPQIYSGFDIDVIMFYRGVNSLESSSAEFLWEGADGTTALTSRFSTMPRYNFYFYIYRKVLYNENIGDVESYWNKGLLFHSADANIKEDYFNVKPCDEPFYDNIKEAVQSIIREQADDFTTPHVIWMEGHDSSGPHKETVNIIKAIKKEFPSLNVKHSTLEEYSDALKTSADYNNLTLVKGERRSAQFDNRSGNLYGYTTSARMYLKQKNFDVERMLQYYAEPFNSIASLIGEETDDQYLSLAWKYLIQNSAHDSIGGCSLDEVHEDMMWRYKQSSEISRGIISSSYKSIIRQIKMPGYSRQDINLTVFNPLPFSRSEIKELFIDIPAEYDEGNFCLRNDTGAESELVIVEKEPVEPVLEQLTNRPMLLKMIRYKCLVYFKDIQPFGYNAYSVIPCSPIKSKEKKIARIKNNLPVMENDYLRIGLNKNGTINIFNKEDNIEILNTGYLYDEGEAGNAWVHRPVEPFLTTLKSRPAIKLVENNSLTAECKIQYSLRLPVNKKGRKIKSGKYIKQNIECIIKLNKYSKSVEYFISTNNKAEDHRLRIMFPTGIQSDFSYGEGQFDVVKRSTGRPDTSEWIEQPMYDFPMHHFADITNGEKGAAVIVDGLKEYEILPDKKTIAITLLRCFEYVIQPSAVEKYTDMKGSQCPGRHTFHISFYPHKGNWIEGGVFNEALQFNYGLNAVQSGNGNGKLPSSASFIKIDSPDIVMSCFKKSEDNSGYILRLYNPTKYDTETYISTFFRISKAEIVTLEEKFKENISTADNHRIFINISKKKILTLKISFNI